MSEAASYCSAADIRNINQTKEYTLISTKLLDCVFGDTRLNDHQIKCWQLLYNKAKYSPNLEVTISYSEIANKLKKSKRTIMRYIKALSLCSYLEIVANSNQWEGKQANTLRIRAPFCYIEQIESEKNRTKKENIDNKSKSSLKVLNSNVKNDFSSSLIISQTEITLNCSAQNNSKRITNITYTAAPSSEETYGDTKSPKNGIEEGTQSSSLADQKPVNTDIPATSLSLAPTDSNVTQYNTRKKEINNNNVVEFKDSNPNPSIEFKENEYPKIFQELAQHEETLRQWTEAKKTIVEKFNDFVSHKQSDLAAKLVPEMNNMDSAIYSLELAINKLRAEENKFKEKENLKNDAEYLYEKSGKETIPAFTFKRLVKALESYGYVGESLNLLTNQVIFEVTFGSLIKSNQSGESLTYDHAINIALKLVREGRWSVPIALKKTKAG